MIGKIRKVLISFLQSNSAPDFIYNYFFKRTTRIKRELLFDFLQQHEDLLEGVSDQAKAHWIPRIDDVLNAPDNVDIPRSEKAGSFSGNELIMHNGIKIDPLSYYSYPMLKMLMMNRGVHEPQEEKIFQEVLQSLQAKQDMRILELGAYWSFYSMWFKQVFPEAECYMVEPDRQNLSYGKMNFNLNKLKGKFIHASIAKTVDQRNKVTTVDTLCDKYNLDFIDILHSDIQGFELDMLHGADQLLSKKGAGYVFISTHSNELHHDCKNLLENKYGYKLVASADLNETFSWDGILVLKSPDYQGVEIVEISKKAKQKVSSKEG